MSKFMNTNTEKFECCLKIEQMPEFFLFCAEVMCGRLGGLNLDRDAFDDAKAGFL